jgi:hypothetical protein
VYFKIDVACKTFAELKPPVISNIKQDLNEQNVGHDRAILT